MTTSEFINSPVISFITARKLATVIEIKAALVLLVNCYPF